MLIKEGTTSSLSRNPSPDIILAIANPNTGRPGQGSNPEALGGVSRMVATTTVGVQTAQGSSFRADRANDGDLKGNQRHRGQNSPLALQLISLATQEELEPKTGHHD